jgi:RHS repeat-associated protein
VHDARGRLTARVDGIGQRCELRHDPDGLLVELISPTGLVETFERDGCGRVTRHRVPGQGATAYGYDPAGRVVAVTDRHGRREFTRDPAGRIVAATDALGHTTGYAYDQRGHLVEVTDPLGGVTRYAHDECGRVTAVTDPLGRTTRYGRDEAGRVREQHDPTGARRRVTRDPSGRPSAVTATADAVSMTIRVERDVLARPIRITETRTSAGPDAPKATFSASNAPKATFGDSGSRCETIELRWDAAGRLVERRTGDTAVRWSYDPDGLRTGLTHPDGTVTSSRRDGAGRVVALEHPLLGRLDLQRDPDGRLLGLTGPGVAARWSYTDGGLTGHEWRGQPDQTTRLTRLTRDEHGRVVAADTGGRTRLFGYDPAGQLVHTADPTGERRFTYDPAGRLVTETGPDGQRDHTYDAAGQLRTSTGPDGPRDYRYDQAGRRVAEQGADDGRSYRWDPFGRLTGVDTAVDGITRSTPFHVDALGELTHAGGVPLAWDTAEPTAPPVALGDQAVVGNGHPWALASEVLDVDWRHTVGGGADPWGQDAAGTDVGLGFRGELVVDGLVWLRARAYDPATRAFLTPDPLEAVPGTAYAANPYHYAGNDPVNQLDPLGLRPVTDAELAGEHDSGGGLFSKIGHGVLDVAGLVPGVGEVADLANAAWYTAEGDYTMAALSAAAAVPFAGWAATGAKAAIKGTAAAEKLTAKAVVEGAQGAKRAPDFIASADGTVIPTSRARLEGGFRDAGFPSAPTPKAPGVEYTLPSGTHVRVMEPSGQAPLRASFTNANGGPVGAFSDKPVQPPPGLDKPARLEYIRQRTHVELGP